MLSEAKKLSATALSWAEVQLALRVGNSTLSIPTLLLGRAEAHADVSVANAIAVALP